MRESISYLSQCRANIFAQTTTESVLDELPYGSDAGVHKEQRFCKTVFPPLHSPRGGPPCKVGSQLLALGKFGTAICLFFAFPSALSPPQLLGTFVPVGRSYGISELGTGTGAPLRLVAGHPARHGLHCDETNGERVEIVCVDLFVPLTQVTSTTILVAVAQLREASYIYQWVSAMHEPWLLLESAVTHLKTLAQDIC